jgi:hypothetical protein
MSLIQYERRGDPNEVNWFKNWSSSIVMLPTYSLGIESGRVRKLLGELEHSESATGAILDTGEHFASRQGWWSDDVFKVPSDVTGATEVINFPRNEGTLKNRLYDALAAFKIRTAQIAMHLADGFRQRLFRQLDSLLSKEDWVEEDEPPTLASFSTFLRLILFIKPAVQPGLGATHDGHLIAMWTTPSARLSIECLPNDQLRWVLSRSYEGSLESAAGCCELIRIPSVLSPYDPQAWFEHDDSLRTP